MPHHPHQLSPDDRVTPIGADTKIKVDLRIEVGCSISDGNKPILKVCCNDFVIEQYPDFARGGGFIQKALIEKGPVDGIDRLENGGIRVASRQKETDTLPAHLYHISGCPAYLIRCESYDHASGLHPVKISGPLQD